MNSLSYSHMGHISSGGMFLDQRIPTEKFKYDLSYIDWADERQKDMLLELVSNNIKLYGNLNPYALVIGFNAVVSENGVFTITKESLTKSMTYLGNSNYEGEKLSKLIDKSDIIRYARLYIRLMVTTNEENDGLMNEMIQDDGMNNYYPDEEEDMSYMDH